MKRVKLTVAYDGTKYHGWQIQPNGVTIEEVLNHHLSELLREPIKIIGASRTDAGCMPEAMWQSLTPAPECRQKRSPMR